MHGMDHGHEHGRAQARHLYPHAAYLRLWCTSMFHHHSTGCEIFINHDWRYSIYMDICRLVYSASMLYYVMLCCAIVGYCMPRVDRIPAYSVSHGDNG
jgi:hypothetical protein